MTGVQCGLVEWNQILGNKCPDTENKALSFHATDIWGARFYEQQLVGEVQGSLNRFS